MSNDQQLEPSLERRLADYFEWLEQHLSTSMSPSVTTARRSPTRRRGALAAAASVLVVAATTAVIVSNQDSAPSINSPATTGSVAVSSTVADATTNRGTIWAPLNLPETMEVVGVYSGVRIDDVSPTTQYFGSLEGTSLTTQLVVVVTGGGNGFVTDTEVHGLPATMLHPSATSVSVEWTEGDVYITATATGLTDVETLALLNATTLRADPLQGIEPQSVGLGMTELLSYPHTARADWSAFAIHDLSSDTYIWVEPGLRLFGDLIQDVQPIPAVGQLLHDSQGNTVFVTTDGKQIALGNWMVDVLPTEAQQVDIARAFDLATPEQVETLRDRAETGLLALSPLKEVSIGSQSIVLRGGTVELPQAVCLRDASNERCHFNYLNRRPDHPAIDQMSITKVMLSDEWFIIGYNQGEVGLGNELVPRSVCIADATGTVTEELPDTRVEVDGREYFTAAVPPTVDYVRSCYLDNGTLVAASSGMLTRPVK